MMHACHAHGCLVEVPPRLLMCGRHWKMLPLRLQHAVWAAYRPGQERTKTPSRAYLDAAKAAIAWVAAHERPPQRCLPLEAAE
ncbi:MAG: hypothetical protein ACK4UO_06090 [Pseudolabrys sp.]